MNKIRTSILGIALAGGSVLGVTGIAAAASDSTSAATTATDTPATDTSGVEPAAAVGEPSQADEIEPDTDTDRAERREARQAAREADRQEVADVLGITVEDLGEQVKGGATLAEIAEANGVDASAVVDVIVQQRTERIDEAVANGRLTAEEAAEITADLAERVQTRVEEGRPERGDGEGRRGGHGGPGDRGPRNGDEAPPADDGETPTTGDDEAGS